MSDDKLTKDMKQVAMEVSDFISRKSSLINCDDSNLRDMKNDIIEIGVLSAVLCSRLQYLNKMKSTSFQNSVIKQNIIKKTLTQVQSSAKLNSDIVEIIRDKECL